MKRCWETNDAAYNAYHDEEWGRPVLDERGLYERLCLEGFQSGLSWLTILRKREAFRAAFAGFDPERVARFTQDDVDRLLGDAGIVRHRGKIEAAIANARATVALRDTPRCTSSSGRTRPHATGRRGVRATGRRRRPSRSRSQEGCGRRGSGSSGRRRYTQPCKHAVS